MTTGPDSVGAADAVPVALVADCGACRGLCCVGPGFRASADFAHSKPPGRPCRNLLADARCAVHGELLDLGYPGCVAYDCFGAGQHAVRLAGTLDLDGAAGREAALRIVGLLEPLHEMAWYLTDLRALDDGEDLVAALEELTALLADPAGLLGPGSARITAVDAVAGRVAPALRAASARIRAVDPSGSDRSTAGRSTADRATRDLVGRDLVGRDLVGRDLVGRDLVGRDLVGADLVGRDLGRACLRGAVLLGADLRGARLDRTDVIGADLRGADLRGADLATALCLTRRQVGAARGDGRTRLPARLTRPAHWPGPSGTGPVSPAPAAPRARARARRSR